MDYKVGTAEGQSEGLKVLGVGEPWPLTYYINADLLNGNPPDLS